MRRTTLAGAVAAAIAAVAASPAFAGPQEDLSACGAIADPAERLACYDRLAGRSATPAPAAPKPSAPAPAASAAPAATAPAASPVAASAPAASPPASSGATARPPAPAADARSFGSYSVEHPAGPAVAQTLTARVVALGKTIDGRPTVTLEGGALWLLDAKDPLLGVGDTVTLSRGVLGSFLLETPTRRLHHVRRIS
jgi:hypothetical protein